MSTARQRQQVRERVLRVEKVPPTTIQGIEVRESRLWLPVGPFSLRICRRLQRHRRAQVEEWAGGTWLLWLPISGNHF
jgi:hypothetical protein